MDAIKAVRRRRADMNVPPARRPTLYIATDKTDIFERCGAYFSKLAYAGEVIVSREAPHDTEGSVSVVTDDARMYMPMAELVDLAKERERMEKELTKARHDLESQEKKLANEAFVSKAPEKVVAAEREKLQKAKALIENLEESLSNTKF